MKPEWANLVAQMAWSGEARCGSTEMSEAKERGRVFDAYRYWHAPLAVRYAAVVRARKGAMSCKPIDERAAATADNSSATVLPGRL